MRDIRVTFRQASVCELSSQAGKNRQYVAIRLEPAVGSAGEEDRIRREGVFAGPQTEADMYARACEGCQECLTLRINVAEAILKKGERRILKNNEDVTVEVSHPYTTDELFDIHQAYFAARHPENPPVERPGFDEMVAASGSMMVLRAPTETGSRPFCVVLFDRGEDRLVDNLCFYDPNSMDRSPGRLSSLKMVEYAKAEGLRFIQIGSWHANEPKWAYKTGYSGLEVRTQNGWEPFSPDKRGPDFRTVLRELGYTAVEPGGMVFRHE